MGIDQCGVIGNDANQPVARHFNSSNHSVSDIKIRALCPISGSNDSREMRLMALYNERFCPSVFALDREK